MVAHTPLKCKCVNQLAEQTRSASDHSNESAVSWADDDDLPDLCFDGARSSTTTNLYFRSDKTAKTGRVCPRVLGQTYHTNLLQSYKASQIYSDLMPCDKLLTAKTHKEQIFVQIFYVFYYKLATNLRSAHLNLNGAPIHVMNKIEVR